MHRSFDPSRTQLLSIVVLSALAPAASVAQEPDQLHDAALGVVDFPVSCDSGIQTDFNRAVALLHHMQYVESRAAFEAIAKADPSCAMAHWGVAVTLFQPLWPARPTPEHLMRGWEEVQKAVELGAGTDRERAFVAAAEAFYAGPETADWWTRIRRWAAAMEEAYAAHPDDLETAAFYALSHMAAGLVAENRMVHQERAAEVLLGVYAREPMHPGALHYTIHANDVTGRADESLDIVRSYDDIAPSVPHALHMPTHIFVRLGAWPEVITWNRRSADAALELPAGDRVSNHYPHAMDYLLYAYLQRGEDGRALAALREVIHREQAYQQEFSSAFHVAAMPARYALERRAWGEAARVTPRARASVDWDRYPWPEALSWFARGLGAAQTGDLEEAVRAEERMRALRDQAAEAGERGFATYIEIDRIVLASRIAHARGKSEGAVALARTAVEWEEGIQKHPVSPGSLLPANEALGDLLMELGRPAEALAAYEASLEAWPRRFQTLVGAARASRAIGEDGKARGFYARLLEVIGEAESERPEVTEAREFVVGAG
jgi:tetratricopeptide (TPR) repeat protein